MSINNVKHNIQILKVFTRKVIIITLTTITFYVKTFNI